MSATSLPCGDGGLPPLLTYWEKTARSQAPWLPLQCASMSGPRGHSLISGLVGNDWGQTVPLSNLT